jgi:hypothetical protein
LRWSSDKTSCCHENRLSEFATSSPQDTALAPSRITLDPKPRASSLAIG